MQKQPIHKHCVKTGVTGRCVGTLKLLNSQEQSFRAFTRMSDVCVQANGAEPIVLCVAFVMLLSLVAARLACMLIL